MWIPNRSDTNRAVQLQKMARGWKFRIQKVEELGGNKLNWQSSTNTKGIYRKLRKTPFPNMWLISYKNVNSHKIYVNVQ